MNVCSQLWDSVIPDLRDKFSCVQKPEPLMTGHLHPQLFPGVKRGNVKRY